MLTHTVDVNAFYLCANSCYFQIVLVCHRQRLLQISGLLTSCRWQYNGHCSISPTSADCGEDLLKLYQDTIKQPWQSNAHLASSNLLSKIIEFILTAKYKTTEAVTCYSCACRIRCPWACLNQWNLKPPNCFTNNKVITGIVCINYLPLDLGCYISWGVHRHSERQTCTAITQ